MKIGVANYRVDKQNDVGVYLGFLRNALNTNDLDLLVGPDYALSHSFDQISTTAEGDSIRNYLVSLSKGFPKTVIVAGTLPLQISSQEMKHLALVYKDGQEMQFAKQTDHGEQEIAEKAGLIYVREDSKPAVFQVDGKKVWLHICGDRGRTQNVNDADLEIILAQDVKAGFHFGATTPKNARHLVLADSYYPKAEVLKFTPPNEHELLKPLKIQDKLRIFKI